MFDPRRAARKALLMTLPVAAAFTACGDGPTQSGMPQLLETPTQAPTAPVRPTPVPGRTTITLETNCPPTDPNPPEYYDQLAQEYAAKYGGAIIIKAKGLTCEKNYAPYYELILGEVDNVNKKVDVLKKVTISGYIDGSDVLSVLPVDSCDGEYALTQTSNLRNLLVPDERTGIPYASFLLYENCITAINVEPDTPVDLN